MLQENLYACHEICFKDVLFDCPVVFHCSMTWCILQKTLKRKQTFNKCLHITLHLTLADKVFHRNRTREQR